MPRRLASQVHITTARLLRAKILQTPPVWYEAVSTYPPIPLPPRDTVKRPLYHREQDVVPTEDSTHYRIPFDLPARKLSTAALEASRKLKKPPKPRVEPIEYTEDRIRRQFFRDHPFEAYRPQSVVERGELYEHHPIQGTRWERLRQHGRNPTPEDAVKFAVCLYEHHEESLSVAYARAAAQFRALRAEHTVASQFAINEARFYGANFAPNESDRGADLAKRALSTWTRGTGAGGRKSFSIRQRFFPVWKGRTGVSKTWSRGEGYTRRWMRGMPPMFWPSKQERDVSRATQEAIEAPRRRAEEEASTPVPIRSGASYLNPIV